MTDSELFEAMAKAITLVNANMDVMRRDQIAMLSRLSYLEDFNAQLVFKIDSLLDQPQQTRH